MSPLVLVATAAIVTGVAVMLSRKSVNRSLPGPRERYEFALDMAKKAGVPLSVLALARLGPSEVSPRTPEPKKTNAMIAKMWVAMNDATDHKWLDENGKPDIYKVTTLSKNPAKTGYFGPQVGKRYSTASPATKQSLELAARVYYGKDKDPTKTPIARGAVKYIDPAALKAQPGVTKTFAQIDAEWQKEGKRPFTIPGVPGTIFYRQA